MSKYRVISTMAPGHRVAGATHTNFAEAHEEYERKSGSAKHHFAGIEEERDGKWVEMSVGEINEELHKMVKTNEVVFETSDYTYTFVIPRTVDVPSGIKKSERGLYILFDMLCRTKRIKKKEMKRQ